MTTFHSTRLRLMMVVVLVPLALALDGAAPRVQSLAAKMLCNCGCGDVLSECSHAECKTRGPLKQEIAAAVQQGKTDEQILDAMGARYGATILRTPPFRGFDMLLWIVPVGGAVLALVAFAWRYVPKKQ